ncbi:MAG: nickel pincer cofactor biosynthesis protein LarC, partial [Thermodesulfobacteriota bacterium]
AEQVKEIALAAFEKLATAEAVIHGVPVEKVHFHEVGGVDAIVDIVGAALCMAYLKVEKTAASPVPLGSGHVKCRHGVLPVPAPATVAILKGVPVYGGGVNCELVTPTGAAILTTLVKDFCPLPAMVMEKAGYGAGARELEAMPNVLRIIAGAFQPADMADSHADLMMETCIDDMNPEIWGHVMERLFEAGARDVYLAPVHMKKNRPGILLCVLCDKARRETLAACILSETTSIGVRYYPVERIMLARRPVMVNTSFGPVQAKAVTLPNGSTRVAPEYEACRKIALERKVSILEVYHAVESGSPEK